MINFGEYKSLTNSNLCFKNRISKGAEAIVFDNGDEYVYKVCQEPITIEELQKCIDRYHQLPFSEHCDIVGYVLVNEHKHYVVRQKKLITFKDLIKNFMEQNGFVNIAKEFDKPQYSNGKVKVIDPNIGNWAFNGNELKLIDGGFLHNDIQ